MATTENITVLFTDLVGSTEMASAISPEAADELRRKHFSSLRQAIASSGGSEVKNLGDGLMVVFPVASAALSCAVAMQQAVHRDNTETERPLGLRVGVSAGEATREAEDYFGDPVIEAARLCARANAGQILISDLVRANAGRRSSHAFSSLGSLELKGLPEPVGTLEVGWEPVRDDVATLGRVPLPARLSHRPTVGVIGREIELATLDAAAKRVLSGEGREVVLLGGEPGQGKTTLVSELSRRGHEAGMTVLLGRCDEEFGAPYRPFSEALSHYVMHAEDEVLRAHVASHGAELARLVPALRQRLGELPPPQTADADTERYLLYAAVVGFFEAASNERSVILVLDDLHWADKPSLQLLRHVVSNTSSSRLLILCTYRDAELSSAHPLSEALVALRREPFGVSSIDLKGLDDTGVLAFMESAAGHVLDDAGVNLAHDLYRETDGNPLFVAEVLRNLSESGAIYQDAATGRWTAADSDGHLALPHSVRAVIGTRVSRLGEEATKVLSTASVIGRDFDLDLLAETTAMDEEDLIDLLEQAHHAALVNELADSPGRYSFSHALIQHTLYEDMGGTRRTRAHRAVGEAIERLYKNGTDDVIGELARHFLLATRPTDVHKAIVYSQRAGEAALAALAPDEAVRYFSQALELASHVATADPTVSIDLLIDLGTAQRQSGVPAFRENLLEAARRARELSDADRLVMAALANSRGWFSSLGQVDLERVEVLEAALDALPETDTQDRARLLATLCGEIQYGSPLERRLALADRAKAIARRLADAATFIDVVNSCSTALMAPSTLVDELADAVEAMAAARVLDDPVRKLRAALPGFYLATRAGQFELAGESLAVVREMAEKLGQASFLWMACYREASDALRHGDLERAERLATEALDLGSACGQPDAFQYYGIQLMSTRDMQGRLAELVSLIADAADRNPTIPTFKAVLAMALLEAGDQTSARNIVDQAAGMSFALPEDSGWFDGITNYARVVTGLQLHDYAGTLIELLAPYADQVPFNGLCPQPPVAMTIGGCATVLGRYEEAEAYFAQAAELNARGDMLFADAQTNLLWGQMLHARGAAGDIHRARELLEEAASSAASRGYAMVERRARGELSQLT